MRSLESPARCFDIGPKLTNTLHERIVPGWCDEQDCLTTMRTTLQRTGIALDPHTAVAKKVADEVSPVRKHGSSPTPLLIFSTAHFGKFPESVNEPLTGPDKVSAFVRCHKPKNLNHRKLQKLAELPIIHNQTCSGDPRSFAA
eukprot:g37168.t1